jgi:hypothetical protein
MQSTCNHVSRYVIGLLASYCVRVTCGFTVERRSEHHRCHLQRILHQNRLEILRSSSSVQLQVQALCLDGETAHNLGNFSVKLVSETIVDVMLILQQIQAQF